MHLLKEGSHVSFWGCQTNYKELQIMFKEVCSIFMMFVPKFYLSLCSAVVKFAPWPVQFKLTAKLTADLDRKLQGEEPLDNRDRDNMVDMWYQEATKYTL